VSLGVAVELSADRLCDKHNRPAAAGSILRGAMAAVSEDSGAERAEPRWWGNHLGELRWQLDAARLLAHPVLRGEGVPHGDGSSVMLLPGFLAGDYSLAPMAIWLQRIGYRPVRVGFLTNTGCSERALERIEEHADALAAAGAGPLALIGHSRGAHQAKALATRRPELVSHVIALGGGLSRQLAVSAPTAAAVRLVRAWHLRRSDGRANGCLTEGCRCSFTRDYTAPFPESVSLTSIYSKSDGVVRWQSCVVPYADNVEVRGTHVGLALNPQVYVAIATALAPPAD
jgi:hypothetical protein